MTIDVYFPRGAASCIEREGRALASFAHIPPSTANHTSESAAIGGRIVHFIAGTIGCVSAAYVYTSFRLPSDETRSTRLSQNTQAPNSDPLPLVGAVVYLVVPDDARISTSLSCSAEGLRPAASRVVPAILGTMPFRPETSSARANTRVRGVLALWGALSAAPRALDR
ncbi:unnamed protein product [Peniophora sp. CBMAI 1063]|nr:unnamed protein product [Peniophora sp. CBMAI 1063]